MIQSIVISALQSHLGKYVQNLDAENFKFELVGGKLELTDLQLKPEALYELDLPIEVKAGHICKIQVELEWLSLFTKPVIVSIEDVYVLAGPIADRKYNAEQELVLQEAAKRKRLETLASGPLPAEGSSSDDKGFVEKLTTTIINNIQVTIQRIHIRYEDRITHPDHPFACGILLKLLTASTTNNKWQPTQVDAETDTVHKLVRLQGLGVYWNPTLSEHSLVRSKLNTSAWRNLLRNSINTHRIMEEDFDFILRPISASARLVFNKEPSSTLPKVLLDFTLDEIEVLVSRPQFLNMLSLSDSLQMMAVNQRYRKYSPGVVLKGHEHAWWHYAYKAVVNEFIRPYSWAAIKLHRKRYREYKQVYKQLLLNPGQVVLQTKLDTLQQHLDVANIVMAREHAKLELAKEAPARVTRKKKEGGGWWSWVWGGGGEAEDEAEEEREVVVTASTSLPEWLNNLTPDERDRLFHNIGYDENETIESFNEYIAQRVNFNLACCSVSLVNCGKEVLKVSVTQLSALLEHKPDMGGFRFYLEIPRIPQSSNGYDGSSLRTESFVVEGCVENELVPLITSDIGVYAPSILTQVFSVEFEMNPSHVEADFAAKLNVQPVEIVYEERAVTEVIAFFQMPHLTEDDVRSLAAYSLHRIGAMGRASLQYVIQTHKTLHLSVNMRSPYVVLPEYGTLHRSGNVLVIDFGKLKVESELQPKHLNLEECTMSEIESRLYDKFNITVTDVKALLADSGDDWHTAQTQPDSEFHVLPAMGMQVALFNTVQSNFTQLPRHKIEARLSTLKLSLSDEKITMLAKFLRHVPMPRSMSMMGLDDVVDGYVEPMAPIMDKHEVQMEPSVSELKSLQRCIYRNSVVKSGLSHDSVDGRVRRPSHRRVVSSDSDKYYSASDHSDEEIQDWAKTLDLPPVDHTSGTNLIQVLGRFVLGEVVVQVSKSADKIDTPYLMLRVNRVCADAALTTYGMAVQASLGGVQLVDKIHLGSSGEYLEMLSSKTDAHLISIKYRKVSRDCEDFDGVYASTEQGLVANLSSLRIMFDRTAVLYLSQFLQGLMIDAHDGLDSGLRKSTSTILSAPTGAEAHHPEPPSFIERITSNTPDTPSNVIQMQMLATLDDLEIRLCDHENDFAEVVIKGMEGKVTMKAKRTTVQARLSDLCVEDLTENTLYPKMLTIEDDNAFDFKMVSYSETRKKLGKERMESVDGSLKLRIGRIYGVFLYKFISEMKNFMEPFTNPELVESYKVAAQQAVHNKIQDVQDQGTRISMHLDIRAPTLLVPQHSESTNVMLVKLGDLSLKNYFEDSEIGGGVLQHWDHMYLNLDAMQLIRGKLNLNGNVEPVHRVVEPINLKIDLKRALPPHRTDLHYDLCGELHCIQIHLTEFDLKLLMAILRENMTEISNKPEKIDECDLAPMTEHPIMLPGYGEMTTPVVEIEEPLLSAPEVMELVRQTKFSFSMDGVTLTLLSEEDDPLILEEGGDGFCLMEIGKLALGGLLNNDSSLEVHTTLQSILMKDIREHSNLAIRRMLQSSIRSSAYEETPPMLELVYRITPEGNNHLDVNMETIRLNLCVPYLLMVTHFFSQALQAPEEAATQPPPTPAPSLSPSPPPEIPRPGGHGTYTTHPRDRALASQHAVSLSGKFKQLEVVLFAEPTQPHSRVIVLKVNGMCDYFSLREREHLDAKVKQLQIVSCVYGQAHHTASMVSEFFHCSQVLHPCDLEFSRTRESADSEVKVVAAVSEVYLHVSSTTLHILLDVLEILNQSRPVAKATHDVSLGCTQYYDLWTIRNISPDVWLQPQPEEPSTKKYPLQPMGPPEELLHIDLKKVQVMFEVENLDYHVPQLCLKLGAQADIQDWSKQLRGHGELQLEMSYYNDKLAVWEPLIEPIMMAEGNYRPWEVLVKMVRAQSHPISSNEIDFNVQHDDDIDGEVHLMMSRAHAKSDSSDTETDSDTEMTIIKPRLHTRKARHGSHTSYDSVSHHSSIQGESDSEPELISTISSNLDSMFSSGDSSEGDQSEVDDDPFDHPDKPVFLTAKGPIHIDHERESGYDELDGPLNGEEEDVTLCTYLVVESPDTLSVNLTPQAMDVLTEVFETLSRSANSPLKSVHDLPGFEISNQTDLGIKVTLSQDMKIDVIKQWHPPRSPLVVFMNQPSMEVYEENLHRVSVSSAAATRDDLDGREADKLIQIESEDEVDGLSFLSKAILQTNNTVLSPLAFQFLNDDLRNQMTLPSAASQLTQGCMHIRVDGFDDLVNVSHKKSGTRLLPLTPCKNDTNYTLLYEVDMAHGRKVITIRSPLRLHNHLTVPIEVYCLTAELQRVNPIVSHSTDFLLTTVEPGASYDVPLFVAYHCRLYTTPADIGYDKTTNGISWQELSVAKERMRYLSCESKQQEKRPFYFKVICEEGKVTHRPQVAMPKVVPYYTIHLYPPVILHNFLPYDIQFSLQGSSQSALTHGENTPLYTADLSKSPKILLQVSDYLGHDWFGSVDITSDLEEFKAITMETDANIEGQNKQLSLGIHVNRMPTLDLYVYSPYWIINKTDLPLQLRGSRSEAVYENDISQDPLLFRFKKHRRKKAKLKLYNSKWTRSFSLDTVGSNGVVICHDRERNRKYQFLLQIQLSKLKLTKIVTVMPYFLVFNNTPHTLRYMEDNEQADLWLDIQTGQCNPFWPTTDSMKMFVKHCDSNVSSQHFLIHRPHITTLRMDKGTALCVDVSGGMENSITISFIPYEHGEAPVRVDNLCEDVFIKLHQKNQSQVSLLSPNQSVLYTWDDPTTERTLMWNVYNRKKPSYPAFIAKVNDEDDNAFSNVRRDGSGEVQLSIQTIRGGSSSSPKSPANSTGKHNGHNDDSSPDDDSDEDGAPLLRSTRTDKVIVHWVSYLDGHQRVLLFTQDDRIACCAKKGNAPSLPNREPKVMEAEQATLALFLSVGGMQVSLVNGGYEEVALVSLTNSATMWEVEVKNKWKTLNMELASLLEQKWRNNESRVNLEEYMEADLDKMEMKKPFMGALRRLYNPALWVHYRCSAHHTYLHSKLHRMQIDNQLKDAYFPTVLYPTPPPAYMIRKSGTRPFVEFAMMRRQVPENNIDTFKYAKLLLQEFTLNLDKGFAMSVFDLIATRQEEEAESKQLAADLGYVHKSLRQLASVGAEGRPQRIVFEYFHLSPIKVHISLSLDGNVHALNQPQDHSLTSDLVQFFLNSVGATLTEVKDVELRMAYYECQGELLSFTQLWSAVRSHYTSQAIQQAYVFLFGLDVLGNPYGLIKDFTQGIGDFFYEPFMHTIQNPDKATENLVRGVQGLMGHTVGSMAGSVSLITGSLGRTLAYLSFDKDYKKRRRMHMQQQPKNLPFSLYMAAKGFVMGVSLGLSGVVISPVRGVQEEGAEGFFKGMGKGLMGLLTKPAGGAIDMVSMAFDGVRRAAEMGQGVVLRMRLPRYINPGLGVRPYSQYQAVGMRILNNLNKGRYSNDIYWAHAALSQEERADVAVVTTSRVLLLEKCRLWGDWDVEWDVPLVDMVTPPTVDGDRLIFKVRTDDTGMSIFTSDEQSINCSEPEVLNWIQKKIEDVELINLNS